MVQSQLFSSGIELAPFVTSSNLLRKSWNVITSPHVDIVSGVGISWKVYKEPNTDVTIVAFEATPSEDVSLFSKNSQKLDQLKSEISSSPKLIITGLAHGGPIASLFTLSLLNSLDPKNKKPLCITFGSPLVGDKELQKNISQNPSWNSSFLHVVSCNDPLPRKFITNHASSNVPFGTFLMCSDTYSTCFENPDSVLAILEASIYDQNQAFDSTEYGNIVENLYRKSLYKDTTNQAQGQQQQHETDIIALIKKMETQEIELISQKRKKMDPSRKLNLRKIEMALLEWYKKDSKTRNVGYYDSYKNMSLTCDHRAVEFQRNLTFYWKEMVDESLKKPQKESASLRTRWLYGGTTYRRMVEPLDIAQYYLNGGKDYVTTSRSSHYKQLEDWLEEEATTNTTNGSQNVTRENVESILTLDSCFWAHVEEALISYDQLLATKSDATEKEKATKKLVEFENYVYGLLMEYAVSPEIFLSGSSYMKWWNQYKGISYNSALKKFMSNDYNYNVQYVGGTYKFD